MRKKKAGKPKKLKQTLLFTIRKTFEKNPGVNLTLRQVCDLVDVRDPILRKLVYSILQDLAKEGFIKARGHGEFVMLDTAESLEGTIDMTARGAGFVTIDGRGIDVYISPNNVQHALNGDRVRIKIIKQGKNRDEGKVLEVIERDRTQFVGSIQMHDKFAFMKPDNLKTGTDIFIPKEKLNGAKDGDKCLVKITVWPKSASNPYGEVVEVLGRPGSNDTEMISILYNNGIDYKFPNEVLSEAETVGMDLDENEILQRRDFRKVTTFTIDPLDARDFDDAISFDGLRRG